ncbi:MULTISPECIES: restriction endonuclease subunit S [unclassified Gilliamella]|uniref:restriction endonuclease subunit S n=1 Tax=unclassified Gilliamella TaxID=2685620 RepID=UPI00080DECAE|nr:restriction endonuclease subunit S [Gilliamella apicola]OCG37444.1 hypothetical protein A9G32_03350 [Gilliamella apicola]OCG48359.1 hypothetical protein A9G27_04485 [Gilliamella apicola]OCG50197.1 hypothetical protein A9G26_07280 [Gilliamella apicola]
MSQSKKLIPKRRFKGFEGAQMWEKLRLGDHAIIKGRLGWKSLKQEEYVDQGPSMIAGKHITEGIINWNKVDHIPQWRYDESPEIMLKNGDIIFSKDGSLGNPALITNLNSLATINSTMMLVRLKKNISSIFFYQIMLSSQFKNLIRLKVSGSSIPHLFQADMTEFKFNTPEVNEQIQIGEFLKKLDNLINTQQKKLEKAKTLKSAYLTEMFPNEGELKPRLRFSGFRLAWEKYQLGEVAHYRRGAFPQPYGYEKWYNGNNSQPFVQVVDVTNQLKLAHKTKQRISKLAQPFSVFVPAGKIIVTLQGSIGRVAITQYDSYIDRTLLVFENFIKKIDLTFWAYTIQQLFEIEKKKAPGGTIKTITKEALSNFYITLPTEQEQTKIGNFFKLLDDKIALEQKKLDKLKNIKQAYLNEMFV